MRIIFKTSTGTFGEVAIDSDKITPGNGQSVTAAVMGTDINAYLMIDTQESYIDLCLSPDESDSQDVYDHCPIVAVLFDGYDQTFVEKFHPHYNCNEIAWLDDLCCALDNETDNGSHWRTLVCEVDIPDREVCEKCESVAEWISEGCPKNGLWDWKTVKNLGRNIASDYGDAIRRRIGEFEAEILEDAVCNFTNKYIVCSS